MTDRIRTLTVVLERDYRTDDGEEIASAIAKLRGVAEVLPGGVVGWEALEARHIAKAEIMEAIMAVLRPDGQRRT